jgi:hypothetical protein
VQIDVEARTSSFWKKYVQHLLKCGPYIASSVSTSLQISSGVIMALISKDVTNKHASVAFHVCLVLNQQHSGEVPKLQICVKLAAQKAKRDVRASCSPAFCLCDLIRLIMLLCGKL